MNPEERIQNLQRAEKLLLEAADLIDESMRMTGFRTYNESSEKIRNVAQSKEIPESVYNLILFLKNEYGEDPTWTRPLASVKQKDRKDI